MKRSERQNDSSIRQKYCSCESKNAARLKSERFYDFTFDTPQNKTKFPNNKRREESSHSAFESTINQNPRPKTLSVVKAFSQAERFAFVI